ncbi:unnamed protein product [Symbiodinium sp. CCMP2456]|nr:unnamed protein product [Symbiodinium sp. CCMP2456]
MVVRGLHADALQLIQDRVEELRGPEKKSALVHLGSGGVAALQECSANEEALALATEVLAITQEIGNRHEEAWMLKKLSEVRSGMKQYSEALVCAQEAQTIFQELGDQSGALALKGQLESEPGASGFKATFDKDPDVYKWYIQASAQYFQVSVDEAESMVGRAPLNPMQHAISFDARGFPGGGLYIAFRLGAMGYGPSFRPIQQVYRQGRPYEAEQGEPPVALGVLRDETAEEWERVALMQAHAGILDGSLQLRRHNTSGAT